MCPYFLLAEHARTRPVCYLAAVATFTSTALKLPLRTSQNYLGCTSPNNRSRLFLIYTFILGADLRLGRHSREIFLGGEEGVITRGISPPCHSQSLADMLK